MSNSYALIIHGGAGPTKGRDYQETEAHQKALVSKGRALLAEGKSALDVCELMVREMEFSGLYVAGRGSGPNSAGYMELDASIMAGHSLKAGGVAGIRDVKSPIGAARSVMDETPYILLAGEGATNHARAHGLEFVAEDEKKDWYRIPVGVSAEEMNQEMMSHGTVGAVALDRHGHLAAATSTGGLFGKPEGRVGDTPITGSGNWADDSVAISCTGTGEHFMLAGGARSIADRMEYGKMSAAEAVRSFLDEVKSVGGDGGIIAITASGDIVSDYNSDGMKEARTSDTQDPLATTFADE